MVKRKTVQIGVGKVFCAGPDYLFECSGIGSCIALVFYAVQEKYGGMAHIMLPGRSPSNCSEFKTRYAENAIDELLRQMGKRGIYPGELKAFAVGGGNVLKRDDDTICDNNIRFVFNYLGEKEIKLTHFCLGGELRRRISLDVKEGIIRLAHGDGVETLFWRREKAHV